MTNNDILRQLRYIFNLGDDNMMAVFAKADYEATRSMVSNWLKREEDEQFEPLADVELAIFLNGLIVKYRGPKDGDNPPPEEILTNNMILRKLKIALSLQSEDIIDVIGLTGFRLGKHELSAFFRNPNQSQYRPCKDQVLRKFLYGLKIKERGDAVEKQ